MNEKCFAVLPLKPYQLELLSRSKTVVVPKVWAVGSDPGLQLLVMDYLARPLDAQCVYSWAA